MSRCWVSAGCFLLAMAVPNLALAVSSAELYTTAAYPYGRFEARVRFAAGDGVVSSFFLWKAGSEKAGAFWNELDFEKVGAECRLETDPLYGSPAVVHSQRHALALDLCGAFHVYSYEWTPDAIVWLVDDVEIRRETGAIAQAFADNAAQPGMQIHINLWPGDASFGGDFSASILPVHQYVDWVQYSAYESGAFKLAWRQDFDGSALPADWHVGNWASSKNLSTHAPENVNLLSGYAVLSLTADSALGPAGATPGPGDSTEMASDGGTPGAAGVASSSDGGDASAAQGGTPAAGASETEGIAAGAASGSATKAGGCSFGHVPRHEGFLAGLGLAAVAWLLRRRAGK
jgi:endo-1,3-1,4-beta-glycanase ExoK